MNDARNRTGCDSDSKLHAGSVPTTLRLVFVVTVVACRTWKAARACAPQTARSAGMHARGVQRTLSIVSHTRRGRESWRAVLGAVRPSPPHLLIMPVLRLLFVG